MPFFSVIIPTYNRAHLIAETIHSVQQQQFEDWECLVVDDGSSDNTKVIVEELIQKDKRIKYVHQENAERSVARNNGIKHASGEFICFLDSDDAYESNHLQLFFDTIALNPIKEVVYYTDMTIVRADSKKVVSDPLEKDVFHFLCHHPLIPARICIPAAIAKANLFDKDIVVVEDLILWLRLAENYPFVHVPFSTVNYHLHGGNSVDLANTGFQKRLDGLKVFRKRYIQLWNKLSKEDRAFLIGNTHFGIARHYSFHRKRWKAIQSLLFSIYYQKRHAQLKHKIFLILQLLRGKYEY